MKGNQSEALVANILVVDDKPDNLRLLRSLLSEHGYGSRCVINGQMALKLAQSYLPDLILLDVMMPQMDGYEVCQHLKADARTREIPVIFISAKDAVLDKVKAFAFGGVDYITKPFQFEEVLARIESQLTMRKLQKQLQEQNVLLQQEISARRQAEAALQKSNQDLEYIVQERTAQLKKALDFEATLKRITDKVRDSLEESQILQTAVQELTDALGAGCCNAGLYDLEQNISNIRYEYSTEIPGFLGYSIQIDNRPDIYQQLQQGQYLQFCNITSSPIRGQVAIFACPMMNGCDPIGDLWLLNSSNRVLSELEIRLVQQVASQCAIAIRQARLYQAAQDHVAELEKLNQLKDDFVWTVSHELRTPISAIKMALQVLEVVMHEECGLQAKYNAITKYLPVLQTECDQEINLVNDLLLLQQLEAGVQPITFSTLNLSTWLPQVLEPFIERSRSKAQNLYFNLCSELPMLETNIFCMERILTELLTNACKFTPPGEKITVVAELVSSSIQISVANTGVEIPASELLQIFDKFYRIKSPDPWKQTGTGLGLALVKRLVGYLSGSIHVDSHGGQTNFILKLPINNLN